MNREMQTGDMVGLLVESDEARSVHDYVVECQRQYGWRNSVFATNDPRMLAALRLLGYESIARVRVAGVERFMKL